MEGFGIAALIVAVLGIVTPIWGVFLSGIAGVLAIFSAPKGTKYGIAAVVLSCILRIGGNGKQFRVFG